MPIQHAIWTVGHEPKPLTTSRLPSEQLLEDMIVRDSRILTAEWVSIRRSPFWRNRSRMLKPVDPHDGLEGIDGAASAVGLVGVVHADFGGFGEWPERCGVLPVAGLVVCDFHGVA